MTDLPSGESAGAAPAPSAPRRCDKDVIALCGIVAIALGDLVLGAYLGAANLPAIATFSAPFVTGLFALTRNAAAGQ